VTSSTPSSKPRPRHTEQLALVAALGQRADDARTPRLGLTAVLPERESEVLADEFRTRTPGARAARDSSRSSAGVSAIVLVFFLDSAMAMMSPSANVTFYGNILGRWASIGGAGMSSSPGKAITRRGMSTCYRDGTLIVKWDLDNQKAMKGAATRRILELIRELEAEGLL
jgi:hypothetical protein